MEKQLLFFRIFNLHLTCWTSFPASILQKNLPLVLRNPKLITYFSCCVLFSTQCFAFRPAPSAPRAPSISKVRSVTFSGLSRRAPIVPSSRIANKAPFSPRAPNAKFPKLVKRPPLVKRPKPVRNTPNVQRVPVFKRVPFVRSVPKRSQ